MKIFLKIFSKKNFPKQVGVVHVISFAPNSPIPRTIPIRLIKQAKEFSQ